MTDKHLDDALQDLRAELNVTPSPEFAAKVRQRVEAAPAARAWGLWAWAGVAATCAAAVIAVALWETGPQQQPLGPAPATSVAQTAVAPVPSPNLATAATEPSAPRPATTHPAPPVRVVRARTEPEVLVPPDQLIALRRLMASARAGVKVDLPASPTLIDPETGELLPPKPIEIPLITVTPLPGDPDGRSGGSERK